MQANILNNIFSVTENDFDAAAAAMYQFQYQNNEVYKQWVDILGGQTSVVNSQFEELQTNNNQSPITIRQSLLNHQPSTSFPFLPISFFKSHNIATTLFEPQQIFESSGTTQTTNSRHLVKEMSIYQQSFLKAFQLFYGDINEWCIIGLLPSYLERNNSSLVVMTDELIKLSNHADSGFYLNEFDKLKDTLLRLENQQQKTLLIGVTFALLDFIDVHKLNLQYIIIMETGGMKGRRNELTRVEVHAIITNGFGVQKVHSE